MSTEAGARKNDPRAAPPSDAGGRRTPQLALPFALLGVVVGGAAAAFLTNPLIAIARDIQAMTAQILAGVLAGAIGALVTRLTRDAERTQAERHKPWQWLALGVVPAGAIVGGIVGGTALKPVIGTGIGWGIVGGLVALPLCAVVLAAAIRAQRARLGSIVAEADLRQVWGTLGAAAAVATIPSWIAWPIRRAEGGAFPTLALAAAVGGAAVVVFELLSNRWAARRLARAIVGTEQSSASTRRAGSLPITDLGIGEGLRARLDGVFSYRTTQREASLVFGDPERARAALSRATRGSRLRAGLVAVVLMGHVVAMPSWSALRLELRLCGQNRMLSCDAAAGLLEERGEDGALEMSAKACNGEIGAGCSRLGRLLGDATRRDGAMAALTQACRANIGAACQILSCATQRRTHADRVRARGLSERAAAAGVTAECPPPTEPLGGPTPPAPGDTCPEGRVLVPGGTFRSAWLGGEVRVEPLCVDRTEVTKSQYFDCRACTIAGGGDHCTYWMSPGDLPVNCVTYAQAVEYCAYRHARLPTAAEWEWIARGRDSARSYPWGDAAPGDQLCWSGVQQRGEVCPVASFPAGDSRDGVADLAGNVHEWTSTRVEGRQVDRPKQVFVGGSWRSPSPHSLRFVEIEEADGWGTPRTDVEESPDIGLRCVDPW